MITNNPSTWPAGDKVWDVCRAIAFAEGANVLGDAPDRLNNPGDLSRGDEHGQPVIGYVTLPDREVAIQFASKEAGWQALYLKISNIVAGRSTTYSPDMTWRQIAQKYAGNSSAWVNNVANALGVSPDSRFSDFFLSSDAQGVEISPGVTVLPPAEDPGANITTAGNGAAGGQIAQVPGWVWIGLGAVGLLVLMQD
jgi:hypothetical protein